MNKKLKIFLLLHLGIFAILAIAYILAAFVMLDLLWFTHISEEARWIWVISFCVCYSIAFCLLDN